MSIVPPAQLEVMVGTPIEATVLFRDELTGVLTDPGQVIAGYQVNDDTPVQGTYGQTTPPSLTITRDTTGTFTIKVETTGLVALKESALVTIVVEGSDGLEATTDPATFRVNGLPFPLTGG